MNYCYRRGPIQGETMEPAMEDSEFTIYPDHPLMNFIPSNSEEENINYTPLRNSNVSNVQDDSIPTAKKYDLPITNVEYSANIKNQDVNCFNVEHAALNIHKRVLDVHEYGDNPQASIGCSPAKKPRKPESKWPEHLQKTFEDAVSLIPKVSIRNMKICGSSYGRNQYISFYIKDRTGITRTFKQISSHIQALTTSKKNPKLSLLLKNGPGESSEICKRFETIFTDILNRLPPKQEQSSQEKGYSNSFVQLDNFGNKSVQNSQNLSSMKGFKNLIRISFKKFEMSYINFEAIKQSHMFSTLDHSFINSELPETWISKTLLLRNFPVISRLIRKGFNDYDHDMISKIPIIYGNVAITLPPLTNDLSAGCYNLTTKVGLSCLPREEKNYGVITLITSNNFKIQEIFEPLDSASNKSKNDAVFTIKIGHDYWKNYVLNKQKEMTYNGSNNIRTKEETFALEINSIKIQQFIVHYDNQTLLMKNGVLSIDQVEPVDVRCIIIWKFEKVVDQSKAMTSLKRICSIFDDTLNSSTPTKKPQYQYTDGNPNLIHSHKKLSSPKPSHFFSPLRFNKLPLALVADRQHHNSIHKQESVSSKFDISSTHSKVFPGEGYNASNFHLNRSNGLAGVLMDSTTQDLTPSTFSAHAAAHYQTMSSNISDVSLRNLMPSQANQTNGLRNFESFDYSTTLSGRPETSEITDTFTSNIIDNTADTSFSTIEEVESETEKENKAKRPLQTQENNDPHDFSQILPSSKDVQVTSAYNADRFSTNPEVDLHFKIPFTESDESTIFEKLNRLGNSETEFDPLLMEYNNLMFGDNTKPASK